MPDETTENRRIVQLAYAWKRLVVDQDVFPAKHNLLVVIWYFATGQKHNAKRCWLLQYPAGHIYS